MLGNLGLLTPELEAAGNGDLMVVVEAREGADADEVLVRVEELLQRKASATGEATITHRTIAAAAQDNPAANLAVIAVNGAYAGREARKALRMTCTYCSSATTSRSRRRSPSRNWPTKKAC